MKNTYRVAYFFIAVFIFGAMPLAMPPMKPMLVGRPCVRRHVRTKSVWAFITASSPSAVLHTKTQQSATLHTSSTFSRFCVQHTKVMRLLLFGNTTVTGCAIPS